MGMVYATINDALGMVYDIGFTTLVGDKHITPSISALVWGNIYGELRETDGCLIILPGVIGL